MQPLITIIGLGVVIIFGALSYIRQPLPQSTEMVVLEHLPEFTSTPELTAATPSPTSLPQLPLAAQATATPTVAAATTAKPPSPKATPTPSPSVTPTPTAAATTDVGDVGIEFIDLPSTVNTGESFKVAWRIVGPAGTKGTNTTLTTRYHAAKNNSNVQSSTKSDTSNSFGSFTVPASFSSTFSFGNEPATIAVVVTAEVDGKTITAERSISLVE